MGTHIPHRNTWVKPWLSQFPADALPGRQQVKVEVMQILLLKEETQTESLTPGFDLA